MQSLVRMTYYAYRIDLHFLKHWKKPSYLCAEHFWWHVMTAVKFYKEARYGCDLRMQECAAKSVRSPSM